jgi:hypothetical protein
MRIKGRREHLATSRVLVANLRLLLLLRRRVVVEARGAETLLRHLIINVCGRERSSSSSNRVKRRSRKRRSAQLDHGRVVCYRLLGGGIGRVGVKLSVLGVVMLVWSNRARMSI